MATRETQERATLTREVVVEAALRIADTAGLEALSFRRLAGDLGVTPMALYRYVSSKEELLGALMDRVFSEFELPPDEDADWRDQLREIAREFRRVLVAHPVAAALDHAENNGQSTNGLRVLERMLDVLQRAGFSIREAAILEPNLERTVLGLVMLETRSAATAGDPQQEAERTRAKRAQLLTLPPEMFASVIDAVDYLCGAIDPDESFELALDVLEGGLEKLLERPNRRV